MKWTKATIDTTTEAVDFICIMLDESVNIVSCDSYFFFALANINL